MIVKTKTLFYLGKANQSSHSLAGFLFFKLILKHFLSTNIKLIFCALLIVGFKYEMYGQIKKCNCTKILTPSFSSYNNHEKTGIHFLNLIDSALFYKIKGDYYDGINIMGVYFNEDYRTFNELRNYKLEKQKYYFSKEASEYSLVAFASDTIACKWLECKRIEAEDKYGLFLWPEKVSPEIIRVQIFFNPPPGVQRGRITEDELHGATVEHFFPTEKFVRRGLAIKEFKRANDETEFNIYINAGGYIARVYVPAAKKIKAVHSTTKNKYINPGEPVFIKSNQPGDSYLRVENNKIVIGGLDKATTFRIEKYKKDDQDHVSADHHYFIRGGNWNSYLQRGDTVIVAGEKAAKESILVFRKTNLSKDTKIAESEEVQIRGINNKTPYFKRTLQGKIVPSVMDSASTFVFIKCK